MNALDEFIEQARGVSVDAAAARLKLARARKGSEHAGPCPACGGRDGFAYNTVKNAWNCRKAGEGGRDAISLVAHVLGYHLASRSGLIGACEAVLGESAPDAFAAETGEERQARQDRLDAARRAHEAEAQARGAAAEMHRQKEITKARGKWLSALPIGGTAAADYLRLRAGYQPRIGGLLRHDAALDYWVEGNDGLVSIHCGPAMIAPFVDADGVIIGCHQTWIDLSNPPKYRPDLGCDAKGDRRKTKKMRGVKMGGFIPVSGFSIETHPDGPRVVFDGRASKARMVAGEGIETVLAVAFAERFRADTLYVAAGDIGNLAGKADHSSDFTHPTLARPDKNGKARRVRIGGPAPDRDSAAMPVPDCIRTLVLLADGDSERVWTASHMARATARHRCEGRLIATAWPGIDGDFADLIAGKTGA